MTVTTATEMSSGQRVGPGEVPSDGLRLRLQPDRSGRGPLDGGWWPRSADPAAGGRVVRVGWFASMPAGLLTAIFASGQRTDLVTIPLHAGERDATAAMEQAAKAGNLEQAPAILAAVGPGSS